MAEADITEFMLKLIIVALFCVILIGGIFLIIEFKATVKTSGLQRLGIDFGESVLSANCTAEMKGLLNETKLDKEKADYDSGKNSLSGFSCVKTAFIARSLIRTKSGGGGKEWNFNFEENKNYENVFEFPAAINMSDGVISPAVMRVAVEASAECGYENSGNNCYNCMKKEDCENAGCKYYETKDICKPK